MPIFFIHLRPFKYYPGKLKQMNENSDKQQTEHNYLSSASKNNKEKINKNGQSTRPKQMKDLTSTHKIYQ